MPITCDNSYNYFHFSLQKIIQISNPQEKFESFERFYQNFLNSDVNFETNYIPVKFNEPSYSKICNIVNPRLVAKRKNFTTNEGRVILIHAIAHIEYSAIDLALDAAYRFSNMPHKFYTDWLEVASDEIRHFKMLEELLLSLGYKYGDFDVHNSLFEASQRSNTLVERMAVVPRFLEANGLDATPFILEKLKKDIENIGIKNLIEVLDIILYEEIEHVRKGDEWFKYACDEKNLSYEVYFEILERYYPDSFPKRKGLNVEARKKSGFSCDELNRMSSENICNE